ncbi:MAG: antitoxin [Limisphaerales bacterium]
MIKTQVQIPDELYLRAKRVAAQKEWSFAEVVRRGLEYITQVNPPGRIPGAKWKLPPARPCGPFLTPPEQWTEVAHDV